MLNFSPVRKKKKKSWLLVNFDLNGWIYTFKVRSMSNTILADFFSLIILINTWMAQDTVL